MTVVALFGAGGKMGMRLGRNLLKTDFEVRHVEVSDAGKAKLKAEHGVDAVDQAAAIDGADVVILAVPDTVIGKLSTSLIPTLAPGTMVVILDAAAPYAGYLPERADISYFVTHPCHPPIFNDESTAEGRNDHFGGIAAKQGVVNALMQGPDEHYELGDKIARAIYAPVAKHLPLHRRTDGLSGTRPFRNSLCFPACCHETGHGRSGENRRAEGMRPRLPARSHEYPCSGHFRGNRRGLLGCLQQGHRVRHSDPDERRLEEGV